MLSSTSRTLGNASILGPATIQATHIISSLILILLTVFGLLRYTYPLMLVPDSLNPNVLASIQLLKPPQIHRLLQQRQYIWIERLPVGIIQMELLALHPSHQHESPTSSPLIPLILPRTAQDTAPPSTHTILHNT